MNSATKTGIDVVKTTSKLLTSVDKTKSTEKVDERQEI